MSFEHYYSTSILSHILNAFLWAGIIASICVMAVGVVTLLDRKFERRILLGVIIAGAALGGLGGAVCAGFGDHAVNNSIIQANIEKKYDVQSVTFEDFITATDGGHGWSPIQSDSKQVTVKVDNVTHLARLTQDPETAEPTLIDVDTNKEIARKDSSQ